MARAAAMVGSPPPVLRVSLGQLPDDTDRAPQYSLIQWTAAPSGESYR